MKYQDISGLSEKELNKKTREIRQAMFEANMKNALGQLTNPMTIRAMRRDVARLKTAQTAAAAGQTASAPKAAAAKKSPAKAASTARKTTKAVAKAKAKA